MSLSVQPRPSSQGLVLFVYTHPEAGLQLSVVHTLPSSQFSGAPGTQLPPEHMSLVVQALLSVHGNELLAYTQPRDVSHESSVHTLPSSQLGAGPGTQSPPKQVSFVVQALPSLHGLVLSTCTQPLAGLHESSVQTLPSSQFKAAPGTQLPPEHVSFVVHALPSLHGLLLFTCSQPLAGLQESFVHTLPSSQLSAGPGTQLPPEHVSFVVHALPSVQGLVLFVNTQMPPWQVSVVHTLPSLHCAFVVQQMLPFGVP